MAKDEITVEMIKDALNQGVWESASDKILKAMEKERRKNIPEGLNFD